MHHYGDWQSTPTLHWKECSCDAKTNEGAHVDEKNNETGANGADEKCDECGRGYYAVTFDLDGHGTVDTQYIGEGGKVQQPETPDDDDSFKYKGWYKDAGHQHAFDFDTETITSATVIYAWFEDDTTPGASKNHAYALTLDQPNPQKAKKDVVVYYSYKAAADGRYTLSLGMGANNENATFTTTKTGNTVYGKDCDYNEITVDIDKNQTVYILFTYLGEEGDDVSVSPLVTEVTNEPMPADHFLAGEYFNAVYTLEITDRTNAQTLTFNNTTYTFSYIGGKYDRIYFVQSTQGQGDTTYYLSYSNGRYWFSSDGSTPTELEYYVQQTSVALSAIVGYYEPASTSGGSESEGTITPRPSESDRDPSGASGGIIGLYIYNNTIPTATTVRYKTKTVNNGITIAYSDLKPATYNTEKNRLYFDTYVATLKLNASGGVEGIVVGGVTFVRKGEAGAVPPAQIDLDSYAEYVGASYTVRTTSSPDGSQYLGSGSDKITVMSYNASTGVYSVHVISGSETVAYKLTVSQDKKTILLYDENGTEPPLDTLIKFEWHIHDLPTVEATADLTANDFQKGLYLFRVQEAGWYSFTIPANAEAWGNLNPNDYTDTEYIQKVRSGEDVYLEEDDLVAVYMRTPAAITVSVARPSAPAGTTEDNPKQLENGTATMKVVSAQTYYFTYTVPAAGSYVVCVKHDGKYFNVPYRVNGDFYGYDNNALGYVGITQDYPYAPITLTDDLTLDIQVQCSVYWDNVTVSVSKDYSTGATALTLTGTPEDNSLTATTTAATGANYHIASTKGESVTLTGSATFTVKVQGGAIIQAENNGGTYTAIIPAGKDVYFMLESDTQQTLTLTQTFAKGTEGYPTDITITEGAGSVTLQKAVEGEEGAEPVCGYYLLPAGTYTLSHNVDEDSWWIIVKICLNGEEIYADEGKYTIVVQEGDVLYLEHNNRDDDFNVTIVKKVAIFTDAQAGTYVGSGFVDENGGINTDLVLTFDKYGAGTYSIDEGYGPNSHVIEIIDNKDGTYTFTHSYGECTVTFSFDNGVLKVDDEYSSDSTITMEKAAGTADNPKVVELTDGAATVKLPAEEDYYIQLPAGNYSIDNDGCIDGVYIKNSNGDENPVSFEPTDPTISFTVSEGDVVIINHYFGGNVTITEVTE